MTVTLLHQSENDRRFGRPGGHFLLLFLCFFVCFSTKSANTTKNVSMENKSPIVTIVFPPFFLRTQGLCRGKKQGGEFTANRVTATLKAPANCFGFPRVDYSTAFDRAQQIFPFVLTRPSPSHAGWAWSFFAFNLTNTMQIYITFITILYAAPNLTNTIKI